MNFTKILFVGVLMCFASLVAYWMQPHQKMADEMHSVSFKNDIPSKFGDWVQQDTGRIQIVDPQQQQTIDRIYTQLLSRTYINKKNGYIIMLSIAYGEQQNDTARLHYPEVCYSAQGFEIKSKFIADLSLNTGLLKVKRLLAKQGNRFEPITYWTTLGNKVVRGGSELKFEQIKYGLQGKIPDGTLIRISSIDANVDSAFDHQNQFINDFTQAIGGDVVRYIIGSKY